LICDEIAHPLGCLEISIQARIDRQTLFVGRHSLERVECRKNGFWFRLIRTRKWREINVAADCEQRYDRDSGHFRNAEFATVALPAPGPMIGFCGSRRLRRSGRLFLLPLLFVLAVSRDRAKTKLWFR
jgi:hypothetical protein